MEKNNTTNNESWYAIYILVGLIFLGLFSILFLTFVMKIVGIITLLSSIGVLIAVIKKKEAENGK